MVVFFFKQKTAYEMRISDWSSDVCSSDLREARRVERVVGERGQLHRPDRDAPHQQDRGRPLREEPDGAGEAAQAARRDAVGRQARKLPPGRRDGDGRRPERDGVAGRGGGQIGRASGRGRGGRYVSITGGAVAIKKK